MPVRSWRVTAILPLALSWQGCLFKSVFTTSLRGEHEFSQPLELMPHRAGSLPLDAPRVPKTLHYHHVHAVWPILQSRCQLTEPSAPRLETSVSSDSGLSPMGYVSQSSATAMDWPPAKYFCKVASGPAPRVHPCAIAPPKGPAPAASRAPGLPSLESPAIPLLE